MSIRYFVLFGIAAFIIGCQEPAKPRAVPEHSNNYQSGRDLRYYKTADPVEDCRIAIRARDFHFLAIGGMADTVPGIPNFKSKWSTKYSYRVIEGTTEFAASVEHIRLQDFAAKYALTYNKTLFRYLESRH